MPLAVRTAPTVIESETPAIIEAMVRPPHGDFDDDGDIEQNDLALFVATLIEPEAHPDLIVIADTNGDGSANGEDIPEFTRIMIDCQP